MMEEIKIIRLDEIEPRSLFGSEGPDEGWIKRVIYPPYVDTQKVYLSVLEVNPGFYAHRWHTHTSDRAKGCQIVFPEGYVEIYHLISGKGIVQWRSEGERIEERSVGAGDTIYFPMGVPRHQLINNGTEKIRLIVIGVPVPKIIFDE